MNQPSLSASTLTTYIVNDDYQFWSVEKIDTYSEHDGLFLLKLTDHETSKMFVQSNCMFFESSLHTIV